MTRRRVYACAILLAAVIVAVPSVPGVWERLVYRDLSWAGLEIRAKRLHWLPGRVAFIHDQVCHFCLQGSHESCLRIGSEYDSLAFLRHGKIVRDASKPSPWALLEYPRDFRCTCTDPSHDRDSE